MSSKPIPGDFPYTMKRLKVRDSEMAYIDVGEGKPVVFLHPTSSYIFFLYMEKRNSLRSRTWPVSRARPGRNGESGKSLRYAYQFTDHADYLDAWFDTLDLQDIILVVHDWGQL